MNDDSTQDHRYVVNISYDSAIVRSLLESEFDEIQVIETKDIESIKSEIEQEENDILIVLPYNFDEEINAFTQSGTLNQTLNIEVFYNSMSTTSMVAKEKVFSIMGAYESSMVDIFRVNESGEIYDLADEQMMTAKMFSMLIPLMMMTLLYSSALSISSESIAGEKERGTFAMLISTPVPRSHIAYGKILGLSIIGLLGGMFCFIGTMLAIPNLMGVSKDAMDANMYHAKDYGLIYLIMISTTILMISMVSLISTIAHTMREVNIMSMPIMIVVLFLTMLAVYIERQGVLFYIIPLYNSAKCITDILSYTTNAVGVFVAVVSNLFYSVLLAVVISKMFERESVIFG